MINLRSVEERQAARYETLLKLLSSDPAAQLLLEAFAADRLVTQVTLTPAAPDPRTDELEQQVAALSQQIESARQRECDLVEFALTLAGRLGFAHPEHLQLSPVDAAKALEWLSSLQIWKKPPVPIEGEFTDVHEMLECIADDTSPSHIPEKASAPSIQSGPAVPDPPAEVNLDSIRRDLGVIEWGFWKPTPEQAEVYIRMTAAGARYQDVLSEARLSGSQMSSLQKALGRRDDKVNGKPVWLFQSYTRAAARDALIKLVREQLTPKGGGK